MTFLAEAKPWTLPVKATMLNRVLYAMATLAILFGLIFSSNPIIWIATVASLPMAITLSGVGVNKPIILAHLGLFWVAIFGSVLIWDLKINGPQPNQQELTAVYLSLGALFAMALGYRIALSNLHSQALSSIQLDRQRLFIGYLAAFGLSSVLIFLAYLTPALTQPVLAFTGVKLLLLYLLAAQVFHDRKGYIFVAVALCAELASGITGYIASYQLPVLVILAASISSYRGALRYGQMLIAGVLLVCLLWASLVWTAVKADFRFQLQNGATTFSDQTSDRLSWILDRVTSGNIDYSSAFVNLTDRIGYTHFYALALPGFDNIQTSFWSDAVKNTVMPRAIFADKAALDDTAITTALTGVHFDGNTSVSIGFVAQTHADFGFPLMLGVLTLLGMLMGGIARFFQTRPISQVARDGFTSAALVYKFIYEQNVDKAFGSLALSTLALGVFCVYVYPLFENWARQRSQAPIRKNYPGPAGTSSSGKRRASVQ